MGIGPCVFVFNVIYGGIVSIRPVNSDNNCGSIWVLLLVPESFNGISVPPYWRDKGKEMPTAEENKTAKIIGHQENTGGQFATKAIIRAKPMPKIKPINPPTRQIVTASIKIGKGYLSAGAQSLPNADFPGALSYGNQHNIHHADTPTVKEIPAIEPITRVKIP